MHPAALACQERCVNGPPSQGVSKCELFGGYFDHELGRNQFFHDQQELFLIIVGELLEKGKIKMPPGHSSQGEHLPGRFSQMLHALLHRILNALRNALSWQRPAVPEALYVEDIARGDQGAERFFDEKRVALGQRVEPIQQFTVQETAHIKSRALLIEERREHESNIVARKRRELHLLHQALASKMRDPATQLWTHLVVSIRNEQKKRMRGD